MTPHLIRRCVSCGEREQKHRLLRFVNSHGRVALDTTGRMEGRGAYCHRKIGCISAIREKAKLKRPLRLLRALRCVGETMPVEELESLIKYAMGFADE